jgi:glycosyltransferase involved in cell wall biosynthesis
LRIGNYVAQYHHLKYKPWRDERTGTNLGKLMGTHVYDKLVARASDRQLPLLEAKKEVLWVVLASLARGGAERIVLDWLTSAVAQEYEVRLAVQTNLPDEWPVPENIPVLRRKGDMDTFMQQVAVSAKTESGRICVHLVRDQYLEVLWNHGLAVIPTVHNAKAGWRNDPTLWSRRNVPFAIAVSEKIGEELKANGCEVPVVVIRHRPNVSHVVLSDRRRFAIRLRYHIEPDELFIGMIGSFKSQKNYERAMAVLAKLKTVRKAKLFIAGGYTGDKGKQVMLDLCKQGARLKLTGSVFLPGFVDVEAVMSAFDVVLNTSDFEGYSIATQEALFSGLPVIASNVGGQSEIDHPALTLVEADDIDGYVQALKSCPVRTKLSAPESEPLFSTSRLWTLAAVTPIAAASTGKVLFLTANLNAGGAQRSLVNLTTALVGRLDFEVAVTGISTNPFFGDMLEEAGVKAFRPCVSRNVLDIAEALLTYVSSNPVRTLVFWNMDPKLKLLLTKFLPHHRIIDVSPGHYAFLEMDEIAQFQKELAFTGKQCYEALEALVLKFTSTDVPPEVKDKLKFIPNGVPEALEMPASDARKLVVQGRIAESKQLDVILAAMPLVREHVTCELHIYGQAEERAVEVLDALLAQAEPMKGFVFFHGANPDLVRSLGQFDGAVVLGMHQGCPNAVLEALAAGVPVVANDSGGTRELVIDGQTGVLLPEEVTAESLASAVVTLLRLDRAELKRCALMHAKQFSMDTMCKRYLNLFEEKINDYQSAAEVLVEEQDFQADAVPQ